MSDLPRDLLSYVERQLADHYFVKLQSELAFGVAWTDAATHEQRLHRLDHLATGFPWSYADDPDGFDNEPAK